MRVLDQDAMILVRMDDRRRLPLGQRENLDLHAAEWLLGVVQDNVPEATEGIAFASRLAVGMARPVSPTPVVLDPIYLKELASPKPPSPALYVRAKTHNRAVSKTNLVDAPQDHRFQGTKVYLHAWRDQTGVVKNLSEKGIADGKAPPWQSLRPPQLPQPQSGDKKDTDKDYHLSERQVEVQPIAPNEKFRFEIRFDNLTAAELNMLCAALRPSAAFEHKLGMGRPIGMGSVKLSFVGLTLEDRGLRYSTGAASPRPDTPNPAVLAEAGMAALGSNDPDLYRALLALGEPGRVRAPVHYPQVHDARIEDRNYRWWVENDKLAPRAHNLKPIV